MSEWTTFKSPRASYRYAPETVSGKTGGWIVLSLDLAERLGNPARVELLTNGSADQIGIRATTSTQRGQSFALMSYPNSPRRTVYGRMVSADTLLQSLGRQGANQRLPHDFEGDILVIDISGLPARQRRGAS